MSNKQRRAWRPWAYAIVLVAPPLFAYLSWYTLTDRSTPALVHELDRVAVGLWFILLAAAWLRARKQESKALRHAVALRSRADVASMTRDGVEGALLRAQNDLALVGVMWQMFFILFGFLRLLIHFSGPMVRAGWEIPN